MTHLNRSQPFRWYLPTFHGDILLESISSNETKVRAFELTPTERAAMARLRDRALKKTLIHEPWAAAGDFESIESGAYRTKDGATVVLSAPIASVQAVLAKALKPNRKLLHAVRFTGGLMQELRETKGSADAEAGALALPVREKPEAAATVAEPVVGCPTPEFPESEVRANRVLEAFLDLEQVRDYRRHGVVMATGADTGHQYAITHRERRQQMRHRSYRSLYDMTEDRPLCVHDWAVPAPEEMLALLFCVVLPGNERRIRHLPETWH